MGALRFCNGQTYGPTSIPLSSISGANLGQISSFVEGNDGEIYVTYGGGTRIGKLELQ